MRKLRVWFMRFGGMFGRERRERELAEELESNLRFHMEDNQRTGMSPEEARFNEIIAGATFGLDKGVLLFTVGLAVASLLGFGMAPAVQLTRPRLRSALKESSRTGSAGRPADRDGGLTLPASKIMTRPLPGWGFTRRRENS